jgi:hypothetical protein
LADKSESFVGRVRARKGVNIERLLMGAMPNGKVAEILHDLIRTPWSTAELSCRQPMADG